MWPYVRISSASSTLPPLPVRGPEDLPGVVEQGDVGRGPADVLDALGPWPMEGADLRLGERAGGGEAQQRRRAEQVVEQLGGRRATATSARARRGRRAAARSAWRTSLVVTGSPRQEAASAANTSLSTNRRPALWRRKRRRAALTMRAESATVRRTNPVRNGTRRSARSGRSRSATALSMTADIRVSPLTRAASVGVALVARARPAHVGDEVGQHDLLDAGLAERREHPLDVAQEHPVRSDDEDALVLQREAVGVQQVRRAVEGDDGLAGARTALDDEHTGLRRADDLVLLGLDRGDDVAERAGAAALEGGEQRRVARRAGSSGDEPVIVADAEVPAAEQLVLDAEHVPALDREVPPPDEAHRLAAGGAVERLGDRCPPVDDDRVGLLVGDGQAADVEALRRGRALGIAVDPPEHQCGVAEVEVGQALDQGFVEGVAFEAGLERAPEVGLVEVSEPPC